MLKTSDVFCDEALPSRAEVQSHLGATNIEVIEFDHGFQLGVSATWGDLCHAVRVPTTGRKPHHSNPKWQSGFPVAEDFDAAIAKLIEWREAQP